MKIQIQKMVPTGLEARYNVHEKINNIKRINNFSCEFYQLTIKPAVFFGRRFFGFGSVNMSKVLFLDSRMP